MSCDHNLIPFICDTLKGIVKTQSSWENGEYMTEKYFGSLSGGYMNFNTIPIMLMCKGSYDFFISSGVFYSEEAIECFKTPIFRVLRVIEKNNVSCFIVLELLQPQGENGATSSYNTHDICSFFVEKKIKKFVRTGICITVDVECFCGVECLPPVNAQQGTPVCDSMSDSETTSERDSMTDSASASEHDSMANSASASERDSMANSASTSERDPMTSSASASERDPMANSASVPVTDPMANSASVPVTDPMANSASVPVTDPMANSTTVPVTDPMTTSASVPVTDPMANSASVPVTDPMTTSASVPVTDPMANSASVPVLDSMANSTTVPVTDPMANSASVPVTDPMTTSASVPVTNPMANSTTVPILNPMPNSETIPVLDSMTNPDSPQNKAVIIIEEIYGSFEHGLLKVWEFISVDIKEATFQIYNASQSPLPVEGLIDADNELSFTVPPGSTFSRSIGLTKSFTINAPEGTSGKYCIILTKKLFP